MELYFFASIQLRYKTNIKRTNLCAGCQKEEQFHYGTSDAKKWNYQTCTILKPTDSYGVLTFPGSHSKSANVILSKLNLNLV